MNKQEIFEKIAQSTPSLLETRHILDRVEDNYYINNPRDEIRDKKKALAEIGIPAALGTLNPSKRLSLNGKILSGLIGGVALNRLADAGRRQRMAESEGIDTDLLGLRAKPLTEEAKNKYFNHL